VLFDAGHVGIQQIIKSAEAGVIINGEALGANAVGLIAVALLF
jgi:hypothetical protein